MDLFLSVGLLAVGCAGVFGVLWARQQQTRNAGIVDVGWAYAVGALLFAYALIVPGDGWRQAVIVICGGFWSMRLGMHILQRYLSEAEEDRRYRYLREHWGRSAGVKFFLFFQGQALAAVLLTAPLLPLFLTFASPGIWTWLGAAIIMGAVFGEWRADVQLHRWRTNPANRRRTCRAGLWRYSRHPNYFFEWAHWLGYPVMALDLWGRGGGAWGWLTLVPSLIMLALLLRGTGIPYTEKQALRSRGEDYARYQREVSAFVPWFPRKGGGRGDGEME
jgi:steroid 5-alpha reductase family enzyme